MAYNQERVDSQPLFNAVHFGQEVMVQMATNLADTKHNKFDTGLDWDELTKDLTESMTDLVEMERRLDNSAKATADMDKEIKRMFASGQRFSDISELNDKYDQKLADIAAANEANVEDNGNLKKLKDLLKEFAEEEDDEDLMALSTEEERIPIDPFSKTEINNPVKNKTCGHIYDGDQLREVLKARAPNQRQRCPIVGCNNRAVTLEDCSIDHKTKALIQRLRNE